MTEKEPKWIDPLAFSLKRRIEEARECAVVLEKFVQCAYDCCNFLFADAKKRGESAQKYGEILDKLKRFDSVKETIRLIDEVDEVLQISSTDTDAMINEL